jgi:hypothetical protein
MDEFEHKRRRWADAEQRFATARFSPPGHDGVAYLVVDFAERLGRATRAVNVVPDSSQELRPACG